MTPQEKDDFAHALGQTLEFFGKTLDKQQFAFWHQAIGGRSVEAIKRALLEYTKVGKFAPKPAHILELMASHTSMYSAVGSDNVGEGNPCPPEIEEAWLWFLAKITGGARNLDGVFTGKDTTPDDEERFLFIVNQEAKKYGIPEAIPKEFRLREIWGEVH